jgi:hypothetical protein
MGKGVKAGVIAVVLAGLALPVQAKDQCWTQAEKDAQRVRELQLMLMVSALHCNARGDTQAGTSYNRMVTVIRPAVSSSTQVLAARFRKVHGAAGQREFDSFVTRLANAYSNAPRESSWCAQAASIADQAAQVPQAELASFADSLVAKEGDDLPVCGG